jgi:hypothetical protein
MIPAKEFDQHMTDFCTHDWRYELELYMRDGKRYVCMACGLKVEHFEGCNEKIESKMNEARLNVKNT